MNLTVYQDYLPEISAPLRLKLSSGTFVINEISPTSEMEIEECLEVVSQGKGLGSDCIPDIILQLPNRKLRETPPIYRHRL